MRSGFLPARVVHVHPTRACNLACAHCYSDSSPAVRGALGADTLIHALAQLRGEGYEIISISGGEPLMYRGLEPLVAAAAEQGYRVHLITNGVLLSEKRLAALREHVHLMGVSLDGSEETHNAVRGRHDAFRNALRALRILSASDVAFGVVYGVSTRSLADVTWAFELAQELGAGLLHLRPLAPEGRARTLDGSWTLSEEDCARLVVLAELLMAMGPDAPRVQVDLVGSEELCASREQFELLRDEPRVDRLSDAINPLVIDEQGRCLPFAYGIDPALELARLPVTAGGGSFRPSPERLEPIARLLDRAFVEVERSGMPYLDWFAHLTRVSRVSGPATHARHADINA
jgi:pyruvate-formate lyase-activating enzyme